MWFIVVVFILLVLYGLFKPQLHGYIGELAVRYRLSKLDPAKYAVINNIIVDNDGESSEIDHVVVSSFGIFVIETKGYSGKVYGNERSAYWKQYKKKYKYEKKNPVRQNYGHVMALKEALPDCPREAFIPIVVFTGDAELKISTPTSTVIDIKDLRGTIESYRKPIFSEKEKNNIYKRLKAMADIADKKNLRKKHIRQVRSKKSQG